MDNYLVFKLNDYRNYRSQLVGNAGVYSCWDGDRCLYVGMGFDLWRRIQERWKTNKFGLRLWVLGGLEGVVNGGEWPYAPAFSQIRIWFSQEPRELEKMKIREFKPVHNIRWVRKVGWTRLGLTGKKATLTNSVC